MQKPAIYLTFDLERDWLRTGYLSPPSFEGVNHNVPRILDKMREHHAAGTFFLTPEVMENCEGLVREIQRRHAVGLHSHAYYQREFRGWEKDGDSFRNYTPDEKRQMALRDIERHHDYLGDLELFRIGRLEPDQTVLKVISEAGCLYDSSYHVRSYDLLQKLWVALFYEFQEIPVNFHLYGLQRRHLERDQSVILVHPLTPPGKTDLEVYDEENLIRIIDTSSQYCELKDLMRYFKEQLGKAGTQREVADLSKGL